ncbi:hypothetical protein GCM10010413_08070 [Promicromonospora sukumoe]|uniref:Uncharacterized protein n=1 Tax=Promicromonospora sukumoe TaxID=88382 RepID=A0A7W3J597_9MICO|nr:hypothetical protein [Promicromonospora sukumoe]MBA8806480.1 hypothetical protein [Promicromonospora sukumoe]
MHTEYDLAQSLHRDRLKDAEEYRRSRKLREEQKRRRAEARAAHRNDSRASAPALRVRSA